MYFIFKTIFRIPLGWLKPRRSYPLDPGYGCAPPDIEACHLCRDLHGPLGWTSDAALRRRWNNDNLLYFTRLLIHTKGSKFFVKSKNDRYHNEFYGNLRFKICYDTNLKKKIKMILQIFILKKSFKKKLKSEKCDSFRKRIKICIPKLFDFFFGRVFQNYLIFFSVGE